MTDNKDMIIRIGADLADLRKELAAAQQEIERFRKSADKDSSKVMGGWSAGFGRAAVAAGGLIAAIGGLALLKDIGTQATEAAAKFQKLEASLKTVTGSSTGAQAVFASLQEFAAKTPYSLEEVTQAFITLKSRGLTPSMEALTAYGNTASAMGKGLDQMIEAVADAATGEFERLKEFGIVARSEGDKVSVTFRGVTETISKNASDIEAYLRRIGQVQFAGAMAEQSATLGGALSNLGDEWDQLMSTIGNTLPIQGAVRAMSGLVNKVNDLLTTTAQERLESARKGLAAFDWNFENGQDQLSRAMRTDGTAQNARALATRARLLNELAEAEAALATQRKAANDAMKPGAQGETQEQKQQRLLQAQFEALKTGGVEAWERVARQQKIAEGGLAAIQARMDELKTDLSDAASFATPWEAWAKDLEKLNKLLAEGRISGAAYQQALKERSPAAKLQQDILGLDIQMPSQTALDQQMAEFWHEVTTAFEEGLPAVREPLLGLAYTSGAAVDAIIEAQDRAAQAAGDALGNIFTRIQAGDWGSVAEGIGVFQDRLRELENQGITGADAFAKVGEALLDSAEAGNGFANLLGSLFGRDADQNKNAQIGGSIGSMMGQFLPGGQALWSFAGNMLGGMFGGNSKEDLLAQKLTAERDALSKSINAFLDAGSELSSVGAKVKDVQERFGAVRVEAERLSQPLDELTRSYQAQMRAIAKGIEEDLADVLDKSEGRGALAEYRALMKAQEERIQDALLAEVDLARVRRANAAELSAFFRDLSADQLALFAGVERQVARVQAQVAQLTSAVSSQIDEQIGMFQDMAAEVRSQAANLRSLVKQLRGTVAGWDIGPDSALGLDEQLSIAGQRFAEMVTKAKAGDSDAIAGLSELAGTYRDIARQFFGSSEAFFAVEDAIKGALAQVAMVTETRATGMEQLASLSLVQVQLLGDLKTLLATDLSRPVGDLIAAALQDGQLTIGEASSITGALDTLGTRLEGVTGPAAEAARQAVEVLNNAVTTGNIAAISPALDDVSEALDAFKSEQIDAYTTALGSVADVIGKVEEWVLDPDGLIPAAVAAAFKNLQFDHTLNTRIENTFRAAIGVTALPLPLTGTIRDLVGDAIGTAPAPAPLTGTIASLVQTAIGPSTAGQPSAAARMEALIDGSISAPNGGWNPSRTLRSLIDQQFGQALAGWNAKTLSVRIGEAFDAALGGSSGSDWRGTLQSVLAAGSPLLNSLSDLRGALDDLRTAMAEDKATGAAQTAYDSAMQAYVSPVGRAAGSAWGYLTGAKDVDADKGKMTNTVYGVDASTGAVQYSGGKGPDSTSDSRAKALADGLSLLSRQIEQMTGGDLGLFEVNASDKYGSGYRVGSADKLQSFGINDFEGIGRAFWQDALSALSGGDARVIEILKNADLSDFQSGLTKAASDVYRLLHPPGFAAGGLFGGGLRLVGENGPEIEVTGPARYFSAPRTIDMLRSAFGGGGDGQATIAELRAVNVTLEQGQRVQAAGLDMLARGLSRLSDDMSRLAARIDPDMKVA